jgi:sugar phosphate isomerase/epimerase
MELGLIGSAWHGTNLSVVEGIRKTKEIGFDTYDVFEDPLMTSPEEQRTIKETCAEVGLPISGMVGHVHVSDCDGEVHGDVPPGRGVTPIKDCLQAICDTGFDGTVSVELERTPEPDRIDEVVEESYRETARILAELGVRDATAWQPVSST